MKKYVLIDYENVRPESISALEDENCHVLVFVGKNQPKVELELVLAMQRLGRRGEYIKIAGNGRNALDFHIAYYIGRIAAQEREAAFHVISKDQGFDPLLAHLEGNGINAIRATSVAEVSCPKPKAAAAAADRVSRVIEDLTRRGAAKPRTLETLGTTINALFQKSLGVAEIERIIEELIEKGIVQVRESKVAYAIPGES